MSGSQEPRKTQPVVALLRKTHLFEAVTGDGPIFR